MSLPIDHPGHERGPSAAVSSAIHRHNLRALTRSTLETNAAERPICTVSAADARTIVLGIARFSPLQEAAAATNPHGDSRVTHTSTRLGTLLGTTAAGSVLASLPGAMGQSAQDQAVNSLSQRLGFSDGLGEQAMEGAQRVSDAIQNLPVTAHGVALAALIAGLILWLGGSKIVKPMFAIVGAIGGGLAGSVLVPGLGFATVLGLPGALVGLVGGAFAGLLLAAGAFRVVMAVIASSVFGVAGLLIGTAYVDRDIANSLDPDSVEVAPMGELGRESGSLFDTLLNPNHNTGVWNEPIPARATIELTAWHTPGVIDFAPARDVRESDGDHASPAGPTPNEDAATEQIQAVVAASRAFLAAGLDTFEERWTTYQPEQRLRIAGFTLAGLLIGFIIGANIPVRSAAVVTAIAGSAVWVLGAWWLSIAMNWSFASTFEQTSQRWLVIWGVLSAIGALVQVTGLKKIAGSSDTSKGRKQAKASDTDSADD